MIHPEPDHLDHPHSPTAASIHPIVPTAYSASTSPSLRHKSSLIDLKDWVIDGGPFRPSCSTTTTILSGYTSLQTIKPLSHEGAPLVSKLYENASVQAIIQLPLRFRPHSARLLTVLAPCSCPQSPTSPTTSP